MIRLLLLLVLALWPTTCEGAAVQEVRGKVGGAVQLTCRYDHLLPVKGVYFQKKNLSGLYELLVNGFYTNSVKDYLHDEYKHRTRVNRTERSLDFWNLKASDEGHYKCFLMPQDTLKDYDTIFHLTITADYSIPTVTVQECSDHGEGALSCELCCSSFGGYPLANLSWTVLEDSNDVLLQEVGSVSTADKHSGVWNVSQIVRLTCFLTLKHEYALATYLLTVRDTKQRQILTKYRLSDHSLAVERGRFKHSWIPREDRVCGHCKTGEVETEVHFLLHCPKYEHIRNKYFSQFEEEESGFRALTDSQKLTVTLGEGPSAPTAARYVHECHTLRDSE
ncbi:T-lymphocyte activation antigen CD80-like [Pygocentrus nattereri]|uniref:T-lymphocyte activation antigen CD80-like n=1 Tax=Pygocentrus nattereri TaxID=42514 RepID=UPI0018917C0D|nr:T-lymphocyte activation antigen CD80-like [Pygocentrus nattereri]